MMPTQPNPTHPVPLRQRPLFTPYVLMWSIGGMFAVGYLALAAATPELLEDLTPASRVIAESRTKDDARGSARLAADIQGLRDSISQVQIDIAKVKSDVATHGAREKLLTSQLGELAKRVAATDRGAIETAAPQEAAPQREASAPPMVLPPDLQLEAPGLALTPPKPSADVETQSVIAPAQPKLINADAAAKPAGEPAVVKPQAKVDAKAATTPAFTTAVIRPPAKPIGVQISSGASLDSLRLSWSLLAERHADALKNMEARYLANGDEANPNFDLIAGPIKSKADAAKVCKTLAARNIPCKVGDFAGNAL